MAKGAYYPIYQTLYLYSNAAQAQTYGSNYASTLSPNTGSDASSYNCISSVEGKGNCYVDTSVGMTAYYPAFPVWWVPSGGGSGYAIGWTNDSKNAGKSTVSIPSSATIGDKVKLTINRQSKSFTHKVYVWVNGAYLTLTSSAGASYTWDTSQYANTLISDISNAASKKFEMKVETYNGSTFIGSVYPSVTLSIPVSAPTLSTTSMDIGGSTTITTNRISTHLTHKVLYRLSGGSYKTITENLGSSIAWDTGSTTYYSPLLNLLPKATSGSFDIRVSTYRGTKLIGSKVVKITLKVPSDIKPSAPTHTITEATSGLATKFGEFIKGKSKLKVVSNSSGAYGSTIKSYSTVIEKQTYTGKTITSNTITGSGTINIVTTVTDSRGRTNKTTTSVTVLYYTAPKITKFSVDRALSTGVVNDSGTYAKVTMNFSIKSLSSKNDRAWTVQYRRPGGSWTTLSSGSVYSYNSSFVSTSGILNTEYSYEVRLTITDYFGTARATVDVETVFVLVDLHSSGTGLAIGKVAEKVNTLEVALNTDFLGTLKNNGRDVGLTNITSKFTINDSAVTNLVAYRQGKINILRFKYKPASTGWNKTIIVPDVSVSGTWPASIATTDLAADAAKGIAAAYWSRSGVTVTVPSLPLSFTYFSICCNILGDRNENIKQQTNRTKTKWSNGYGFMVIRILSW